MSSHGVNTSPEQLESQIYIPAKKGSLQAEITAATRRHQLLAYPLQSDNQQPIKLLLRALSEDHPVLVLQNLGTRWFPQWHYAVVIGYELESAEMILNSGTQAAHRMSLANFERTWKLSEYWALLASPPEEVPLLAEQLIWNKAANDLEVTGHTETAFRAYQAALQRWPENDTSLLGFGNTAYTLGKYEHAAENFYRLGVQSSSSAATGWNNLAYALIALHCPQPARDAVAIAASLSPGNSAIQNTVDEITIKYGEHEDPIRAVSDICNSWRVRVAGHSGVLMQ